MGFLTNAVVGKAMQIAKPSPLNETTPAPTPPSPISDDPAVTAQTNAAMNDAQKTEMKQGKGRAATVLTTGKGLIKDASTSRRTLLGI